MGCGVRGAERPAGVPQLPAGQGDRRRRRRKRRGEEEEEEGWGGALRAGAMCPPGTKGFGAPRWSRSPVPGDGASPQCADTPPRIPPAPRMKEGVGLNSPPLSRSALRAQSRPPAGARARRLPRVRAGLAAAGAMPSRPPLHHLSFSTWLSQREGEGARCSQKPFSW